MESLYPLAQPIFKMVIKQNKDGLSYRFAKDLLFLNILKKKSFVDIFDNFLSDKLSIMKFLK